MENLGGSKVLEGMSDKQMPVYRRVGRVKKPHLCWRGIAFTSLWFCSHQVLLKLDRFL